MGVDPKSFEYAISLIENGFIFESFACSYLAQILGYEFVPSGGIKDRGIDGLEHIFHRKGLERTIYQASIESNAEGKIRSSLNKIQTNAISYDQFFFVTNRIVKNQDKLIDELFDQYGKPIRIGDLRWLSSHINDNQGTLNVFQTFIDKNLHEYSTPGKSYVISDLINDPRLFVFLRQQWEDETDPKHLHEMLVDSLILYALEGTDPDQKILKTRDEIAANISERLVVGNRLSIDILDDRLNALSQKPRKIKHHKKEDAYCLPYETRLQIQNKNLVDASLYASFKQQSEDVLRKHLGNYGVKVRDVVVLLEETFNHIFYQQGLEFAAFILKGENREAFEKDLGDTISDVVHKSSTVEKNKEQIKSALKISVREIVYNGTSEQKSFLKRLSNTYLMLFLLQCDPKISTFFTTMASKLNIYVCTSIIIPAMSEYYLDPVNRRHWNLLKSARDAGVTLLVNETIIKELAAHFQLIVSTYEERYRLEESVYLGDEVLMLYIDEIMIRAYFYAKIRGRVSRFQDFIENFISPRLKRSEQEQELVEWLNEEFGILFRSNSSLGISLDKNEVDQLYQSLKTHKKAAAQARNDAELILTIYAIRAHNNERGTEGIFSYRTWWLSKDTTTLRAVNETFSEKYPVSCYIRPDFLYNYISLTPKPQAVRESFNQMFPTLLGVNISYHLSPEIVECVHHAMREHQTKNQTRRRAILRGLAEKLQSDPESRRKKYVKHYLDERLAKITES